jgi:hypothetical protein
MLSSTALIPRSWTPDGHMIATAWQPHHAVKLWDPVTGETTPFPAGRGLDLSSLSWTPHGHRFAAVRDVGTTSEIVLGARVLDRAARAHEFLAHTVMPHAVAEGRVLMPLVRDRTGEPTIGIRMTQCHVQVGRLVDELEHQLAQLRAGSARAERELRRILYSLHALLTAHLDEADEEVEPLLEAELPEDQRRELFGAIERCAREVADLFE